MTNLVFSFCYSQTQLYGSLHNTDTSLLRTVCFAPRKRNPYIFYKFNSLNTDALILYTGRCSRWHLHQPHLSSKHFVRHDFHFRGFTVGSRLKDRIESHITFLLRVRLKIICPSSTFFPGFSPTLPPQREDPGNEVSFSLPLPTIPLLNCLLFCNY